MKSEKGSEEMIRQLECSMKRCQKEEALREERMRQLFVQVTKYLELVVIQLEIK